MRKRRSRTERCRYCGEPRGWPCAKCKATLSALRVSRRDPDVRVVEHLSVSSSDVMAFVDATDVSPTVPRFGYKRRAR